MSNDLSQVIRDDLKEMKGELNDQDRRLRVIENTLKEAGHGLGDAGEAMAVGSPVAHGYQPFAH